MVCSEIEMGVKSQYQRSQTKRICLAACRLALLWAAAVGAEEALVWVLGRVAGNTLGKGILRFEPLNRKMACPNQ